MRHIRKKKTNPKRWEGKIRSGRWWQKGWSADRALCLAHRYINWVLWE